MFANPSGKGVYKRRRSTFEAGSHQQEDSTSSREEIEQAHFR
jgi:hypothetical protein